MTSAPDHPARHSRGRTTFLALALAAGSLASCTPPVPPAGSGGSRPEAPAPSNPAADAARLADPHQLRNRAKVHADRDTRGGYLAAVPYLRRLAALEPRNPTDRLNLARALLLAGDVKASREALAETRALLDPSHALPEIDYLAGLGRKLEGQHENALEHFRGVLEKLPRHGPTWFQRGLAEEALGRLEDAARSFEKTLEIEPRHRPAAYRLGLVLRRLHRDGEARQALERLQALPEAPGAEDGKCDLTAVTLRPPDRAAVEPPQPELSWRELPAPLPPALAEEPLLRLLPLDRGDAAPSGVISVSWGHGEYRSGGGGPPELLALGARESWVVAGAGAATAVLGGGRDAVVADFENDGLNDVLLVAPGRLELWKGGERGFQHLPGVLAAAPGDPEAAAAFDLDHDGDLDIVALAPLEGSLGASLVRNNGDGSYTRLSPFAGLEISAASARAIDLHDVDQANDLDLVVAGGAAGLAVFLNRRDGTFSRAVLPELSGRTQIHVEDLSGDGAPDFFATGGGPGWTCARNADRLGRPGELRIAGPPLASRDPDEVRDSLLADLDNDGDLDGVLATPAGISVLRNRRGGELHPEEPVPLAGGAATVSAADLTGDGLLDLLAVTPSGRAVLLENRTPGAYGSARLSLKGTRDNRSALGAVVEHFAGPLYQSLLVRRAGPLHLGLGRAPGGGSDGLRIRWPQGIIQAVPALELAPGERGEIYLKQIEGAASSCPFLYGRGPEGWRFLTDVLGIAPLAEWLPPGAEPRLDPEEHVRIAGEALAAAGGAVHLAVTEELRETAYLDRVELLALDHPVDVEVLADESTRQGAYDPLEILVVPAGALAPPAAFRLPGGRDVRDRVLAADGAYARGFQEGPSQWSGWVERYELVVETAAAARALFLTGRVAWYDSTVAFALAQHGRRWEPPELEVAGPAGGSAGLRAEVGLLAGRDRTVAVLFPDELPAGSLLRLRASHRLLWDRVRLASRVEVLEVPPGEERGALRLEDGRRLRFETLPLRRAVLGYRGFSPAWGDRSRHEESYLYDGAAPGDAFAPAVGRATRYGDVTLLLRGHDDLLVVLVTGDGVEVEFQAPRSLRPGRRRTYFLRASGWAKEGSFHNVTGGSTEPLPFRGMSRYPPPAAEERRDAAYRAYLETYQTREVRRRAP